MIRVFVSYAHDQAQAYADLMRNLKAQRVLLRDVSVPRHRPLAGGVTLTASRLRALTEQAIASADVVLALTGPQGGHRPSQRFEIDLATSLGKPILSVRSEAKGLVRDNLVANTKTQMFDARQVHQLAAAIQAATAKPRRQESRPVTPIAPAAPIVVAVEAAAATAQLSSLAPPRATPAPAFATRPATAPPEPAALSATIAAAATAAGLEALPTAPRDVVALPDAARVAPPAIPVAYALKILGERIEREIGLHSPPKVAIVPQPTPPRRRWWPFAKPVQPPT